MATNIIAWQIIKLGGVRVLNGIQCKTRQYYGQIGPEHMSEYLEAYGGLTCL